MNKLIHGDALEVIPDLPDNMIDGIVTDPPYGESMGYDGDDSVGQAQELLFSFLSKVECKLKRNAHLAIFWTFRNLDICIDVLRSAGFTYRRTLSMYVPKGEARPYLGWLPRTQAIVVGQKYLPKQPSEFHAELSEYLSSAIEKSGLSRSELARQLQCDSRLVMKWTRKDDPSWCLPTPRFYKQMKSLLNLDDQYDIMLERQSSQAAQSRDDFEYQHDTYVVNKPNQKMLHPSQKPLSVVEHLVCCVAPRKGLVLDPFAGSGTTVIACKRNDRNFIAIEKSEEYHKIATMRLNDFRPAWA